MVAVVLNLIITGIPSILYEYADNKFDVERVLNLIITGIPSILKDFVKANSIQDAIEF